MTEREDKAVTVGRLALEFVAHDADAAARYRRFCGGGDSFEYAPYIRAWVCALLNAFGLAVVEEETGPGALRFDLLALNRREGEKP